MIKPFKVFDKVIDNDLSKFVPYIMKKSEQLYALEVPGFGQEELEKINQGYLNTKNPQAPYRYYNVFQFHNSMVYKIHTVLRELVKEACKYYELDFDEQQYMIQGWINITDKFTDSAWHDHGGKKAPDFHGYYSVQAEPSITHYRIDGDESKPFDNKNIDNRVVVIETGHTHKVGDWSLDQPRITIAYDITPLSMIATDGPFNEQHWIPL